MTQAIQQNSISINKTQHPPGLVTLFFAELWERFSFYGMRALLVLYMTKELLFADEKAYGIYGAYGALVYATPVIGGLLADRLLGYQRAIMLGAGLMALGHFCLAVQHPLFFYGGLALLICGNGFFKPNISSLVGQLYGSNDPRRDAGFTIFYMGINIGGFLAPLVCGFIGEVYGWHYGFGLAGIGMLTGLCVFMRGRHRLGEIGLPPVVRKLKKSWPKFLNTRNSVYLGVMLSVPIFAVLVLHNQLTGWVLITVGLIVLGSLLSIALASERVERERMLVILVLMFFHMSFWAFFEQGGSSINLFTDRNVDRVLFGWIIPASVFQSANPFFIILMAPIFSSLWLHLANKKLEPATPVKFALGILQLAAGFAALAIGAGLAGVDGKTSLLWLLLAYFLYTTGELCISPVGLSMVTRLAPAKLMGVMMGAWFLSVAFAHYIAGSIATLTSVPVRTADPENVMQGLSPSQTTLLYSDVFTQIAYTATGVAVILLLLAPLLRRWMHESSHTDVRENIKPQQRIQ